MQKFHYRHVFCLEMFLKGKHKPTLMFLYTILSLATLTSTSAVQGLDSTRARERDRENGLAQWRSDPATDGALQCIQIEPKR